MDEFSTKYLYDPVTFPSTHQNISTVILDGYHMHESLVRPTEALDPTHIPKHVAIIMDGNRRWAIQRNLPVLVGHWYGVKALAKVVKEAVLLGIKTLTVYAFSTENWKRSPQEIESLMRLFRVYLKRQKERMIAQGIALGVIGNLNSLPEEIQTILFEVQSATALGQQMNLVIAMNYGARDSLRRAIIAMIQDYAAGALLEEQISEHLISRYLETAPWGDPSLLIRTSGEKRLSNFLLWEISYAEVYITNVLWPDFDGEGLRAAVLAFQNSDRRRGK